VKYYIVVISFFLLAAALGQSRLKVAPKNPDYIKFIDDVESGAEAYAAPPPYQVGFTEYFKKKKEFSPKIYPIVYDMRTAGPDGSSLLTSVKNQSSCGACWAFATIGSTESIWKVSGLGDFDLSENHMKNCHGFLPLPCVWGSHYMTTAYFAAGKGPLLEADDPYNPINEACNPSLEPYCHIPEARYIPEDHDAIKEVLTTIGGLYSLYRSVSAGYNWENDTYCYQGPGTTSHAIVIVGWNDTLTTDCGKGAWIAKNSYGTGFMDGGFFYISYHDTLIAKYNAIYPTKEEYDPQLKIYQYDTIGGWPFVGYEDPVAYGLIKFTAESDMFITRVGTYTVGYGTTLSLDIFDDFDGTIVSNPLISQVTKYVEFPGYGTIPLLNPLKIKEGEDFYIQVKWNSPGEDFPISVEGFDDGYTAPDLETGKCWSRHENGPWEAWGADTENLMDICIKVYTHETTKVNLKVFLEGPFNGSDLNTNLTALPDFPLLQPYNDNPWNYFGEEDISNLPTNVVDWVLVELRDTCGPASAANGSSVVARRAGLLLSNGTITDLDGISPLEFKLTIRENLYVVIYHRNHLPVISAQALQKEDGLYSYDFSDGVTKALGEALAQKELTSGVYGMIAGDAEASGLINDSDIDSYWQNQAGQQGYKQADFNLNKEVNNSDKADYWWPNEGSSKQVPD